MPTLHRDGVTLHYLDEGQGPAVLLLHAYPLNSEMFRPQIAALSSRYRVIAPDTRGFGKSSVGEGPTEMSTIADDALAILDSLKISSAVVGGVSMGGYAAMAMLRQDAGRVRGLVLIDTQCTADDGPGKERREEAAKAALAGGMRSVAEAMLPKLLAPTTSAEVRAQVEALVLQGRAEGAAAAQRGMGLRLDSKDMLARYAGPALVMVGEHDAITPKPKAEQLSDLLQGSRLLVVPGAGHLASFEAPAPVNAALGEFLAREA